MNQESNASLWEVKSHTIFTVPGSCLISLDCISKMYIQQLPVFKAYSVFS